MSCTPVIFTRRSKKNPYADRGLAEFALLSAELEAKRKKLLVQLGAPLSFVRFSSGSDQTKWVPIIICPTLSGKEIRTLRRAATNLISEDRGSLIDGKPTQTANAKGDSLTESAASAQNRPSNVQTSYEDRNNNVSLIPKFPHIAVAVEKFLWMAAFGLSIVADVVRNALGLKAHPDVPPKGRPISSRQETVNKHDPSATIASSVHIPCLPALKSTSATVPGTENIKTKAPPHLLHVKIPTGHIRCKHAGHSTAPSTPTNTRGVKKSFHASVSLPKTSILEEQGITKETQLHSTVSLARRTTSLEKSDPLGTGLNSTINKADRQDKGKKFGQALTGAGVVVGLGGLVMGYFPAIVSIVCWWYLLPTLRKAVGDKPNIVKSQHHGSY